MYFYIKFVCKVPFKDFLQRMWRITWQKMYIYIIFPQFLQYIKNDMMVDVILQNKEHKFPSTIYSLCKKLHGK